MAQLVCPLWAGPEGKGPGSVDRVPRWLCLPVDSGMGIGVTLCAVKAYLVRMQVVRPQVHPMLLVAFPVTWSSPVHSTGTQGLQCRSHGSWTELWGS